MKFNLKKRLLFILLSALIVIPSGVAPMAASADTSGALPAQTFDSNNIALRFGVMSDTHLQGTEGDPTPKFQSALEQEYNRANGNLDALMITGDITDYGYDSQSKLFATLLLNSKINLDKTRLVICPGNHDYYNAQLQGAAWKGGNFFKQYLGDKVYQGATDDEITNCDYSTVVNGFHFIAVDCSQYTGGVKYTQHDLDWLKSQLDEAVKDDPTKPIFVCSHPMVTDTTFGSSGNGANSYWDAPDLGNIFKDYPQVIYFAGHLHRPESDERSIWQGDYTAVGVGSVFYTSMDDTDDDGFPVVEKTSQNGSSLIDAYQQSQGYYVEVDKSGNVRINRVDFAKSKDIKTPWIVPAPKADKSNLLYYTPQQEEKGNTAPEFPYGTYFKVDSNVNGSYQFEFTQAKDNDEVFDYEFTISDKDTGQVLTKFATYSDFYMCPQPSQMASVLKRYVYEANSIFSPFTITYSKPYLVSMVAVDCFGLKSQPFVTQVNPDGSTVTLTPIAKPTSSESASPSSSTESTSSKSSGSVESSNPSTSHGGSGNTSVSYPESTQPDTGGNSPLPYVMVSILAALALSATIIKTIIHQKRVL